MIKVPKYIQRLFKHQIWNIKNDENAVYLTFDDGPIPYVTEEILKILEQEKVKATFFCIGDNIKKHPDIFLKIIQAKHAIGNHTFNHLKGWNTKLQVYVSNVDLCQQELEQLNINSRLFRPPYGKISIKQSRFLRKKGYKIIMWDVLSKDFDCKINAQKCFDNVVKNTSSGSIIVFHDSLKAQQNVLKSLPKVIQALKAKGFTFKKLS